MGKVRSGVQMGFRIPLSGRGMLYHYSLTTFVTSSTGSLELSTAMLAASVRKARISSLPKDSIKLPLGSLINHSAKQ